MTDSNDEGFRELNEWLFDEMYSVPPADRLNYRHTWTMNQGYLNYCRDTLDTLGTYWQPSPAGLCLYGYEVEVDEKYGVPKLVRK